MISILTKEINEFFHSLIGYVVIGVFLIGVGLIMWVLPNNVLDYGYATMEPLFTVGPYMFMFLVPAITMKSYAEEKRTGTIELLYTLPFKTWEIIVGKFLAALFLVLFSILPTIVYYYSIYQLGNPVGNLDTSGIIGSYIGLFLLGGVFVAIGILSSAITENQIVSFILGAVLCFISYEGMQLLAAMDLWGQSSYYLEQLGIMFHYNSISKGMIDMQDVVYFMGFIAMVLYGTHLTLELKK
ncbi:MAG: gliding motility-associated ABC transporter permease subunit GldF [Cyclobacteriaceae bacterium]